VDTAVYEEIGERIATKGYVAHVPLVSMNIQGSLSEGNVSRMSEMKTREIPYLSDGKSSWYVQIQRGKEDRRNEVERNSTFEKKPNGTAHECLLSSINK
jgi:hypothetical protein